MLKRHDARRTVPILGAVAGGYNRVPRFGDGPVDHVHTMNAVSWIFVERIRCPVTEDLFASTRPTSVSDTLFKENPFFDPKDLLQVRYEMLRRHSVERASIVDVATTFGVSRPTVYQAQAAFQQTGLSGLLPTHRGPKEGHKLSAEVIDYDV